MVIVQAYGGTIVDYTEGGIEYRLHIFTPTSDPSALTVVNGGYIDVMVLGGGGGGSSVAGGAAGVITVSSVNIPVGIYPVVVGKGGIGVNPQVGNPGGNGGNSSFTVAQYGVLGFRTFIAGGGGGGGGYGLIGTPGNSGSIPEEPKSDGQIGGTGITIEDFLNGAGISLPGPAGDAEDGSGGGGAGGGIFGTGGNGGDGAVIIRHRFTTDSSQSSYSSQSSVSSESSSSSVVERERAALAYRFSGYNLPMVKLDGMCEYYVVKVHPYFYNQPMIWQEPAFQDGSLDQAGGFIEPIYTTPMETDKGQLPF
jgi:hypothetical protein